MKEVLTTREGAILTITLNRPEKQNAITRVMYQELADQITNAAGDFAIRVVIIRGEGKNFTAGNDLNDFINNPPLDDGSPVAQFMAAVHNFPKPLLAAVQGNAVGIGTTMLFHCDIVVASSTTKFSMPFVNLGLVPENGSSFLFPKLAGYQNAAKIFLLGEPFGPDFADHVGLIAEINDDPYRAIVAMAEKIAAQPPGAVIQTKALLKSAHHEAVSAVMAAEGKLFQLALQSDEARSAFMNFLSKKG